MTRIFLTVAIVISLVASVATADAGSKKHRHNRHHALVYPPNGAWQAPAGLRRHGPPWAMPNECFNDEGYGRWSPCGGRFD